jgi:hypothetical protein
MRRQLSTTAPGGPLAPLLSCQPSFLALLLASLTAPDFSESHGCSRDTPLLSRFLFDPPEAGRWLATLPVPTPSGGNGAQGRSRMPKAPRSGESQRRPSLRVPSTVALTLSTELGSQLQEDSFYRIHIGGLNPLFESTGCIESAGPFMREFPSRAGPFMRISPSLSGTVYAWISPAVL